MNGSLLLLVFSLTLVFGTDLPWISRLFCGKRRGKCIFAVDFEAILRETAREVYTILDRAAPVWSPNRGRRFHAKEPERHGKAVVYILISLPNQVPPYEKKFIRTNEPFFITLLASSLNSIKLSSSRQRNQYISISRIFASYSVAAASAFMARLNFNSRSTSIFCFSEYFIINIGIR